MQYNLRAQPCGNSQFSFEQNDSRTIHTFRKDKSLFCASTRSTLRAGARKQELKSILVIVCGIPARNIFCEGYKTGDFKGSKLQMMNNSIESSTDLPLAENDDSIRLRRYLMQ